MPNIDDNEEMVIELSRKYLGLTIEKIPEGATRSADFLASDGKNNYLIELKTRYRSDDDVAEREAQFESSGLAELSRSTERSPDVSKIMSDALAQIESSGVEHAIIKIVFFLIRDFDVEERWHNILANLYGIKTVVDWSDEGGGKECYYFTDSDFYRYRDRLDAVIIFTPSNGRLVLCLNDHSRNIDRLRASPLVAPIQQGVIDAPKKEADNEIWLVDGVVDRSNEQAMIAYLREKYSLSAKTTVINMSYMSATVAVPTNPDNDSVR